MKTKIIRKYLLTYLIEIEKLIEFIYICIEILLFIMKLIVNQMNLKRLLIQQGVVMDLIFIIQIHYHLFYRIKQHFFLNFLLVLE
jgi:hypothetical protein